MSEHKQPGAFYGANIQGQGRRPPRVGDDRPAGGRSGAMESRMNIPMARQIPVEGAVTGPDAPPIQMDVIYGRADLDDLDFPPR